MKISIKLELSSVNSMRKQNMNIYAIRLIKVLYLCKYLFNPCNAFI